ncbi:MAG: response regulator [Lapillicoccus sp.]
MIRVLVIDDDYHVARAHALSVGRLDGFSVVGEAHTGAEARLLVERSSPDLLLLDMYLPDLSGLDLVRELGAMPGAVPDFILLTAARDIGSVRSAMQLGAFYYLVKPFTAAALREQLEAYRGWRHRVSRTGEADQTTVDALFSLRASAAPTTASRQALPPTMARVLEIVTSSEQPLGATEVADLLGASRPTAQRCLAFLLKRRLVDLDLSYGNTGRPEHRYTSPTGSR